MAGPQHTTPTPNDATSKHATSTEAAAAWKPRAWRGRHRRLRGGLEAMKNSSRRCPRQRHGFVLSALDRRTTPDGPLLASARDAGPRGAARAAPERTVYNPTSGRG